MVYTRRPAAAAQQANTAAPAYSTMSTRNSAAAGQYQQQPQTQYGNSVTTQPAANYQQSYSTTAYQTQTFTPAVTKPAPAPQPQPQAPVQQPLKSEDNNVAMETGEDGEKPKRKFQTGVRYKVNKRLKRAKRNDTLRRVIKPKNSIMCLHELISGLQFNVQDLPPAGHDQLPRFSVTLQAYGKTYEGIGSSKLIAKQIACENALKGILIDRMAKQAQREAEAKDEPMYDENGDSKGDVKGNIPEDNIPWVSVASFALHKLFSEWQGQGTHLPLEGFGPGSSIAPAQPKKVTPQVARPMPENPLHYQPTMLLHIVRPGVTYNDTTNVVPGGPPTFTASCIVDGKTYSGTATKKKIARKNAAKAALLDMGVTYPAEA